MRFSVLLRNGAFAGGAAGIVAALLQWVVTEPVIRRALAIEDRRSALEEAGSTGHNHDEVLVGRTAQLVVGMCTAAAVAVIFGIIFAIVFARSRHRLPGATDFGRAAWLAAFGFFAFTLMPALAIPSNPPAVGNPDTITRRTLIYLLAILVGVLIVGAVAALDRLLASRGVDQPLRLTGNVVALAVLVGVALLLIPNSPDKIPTTGDASLIAGADLIWDFRLASLLQLGSMWAVLGMLFGILSTRGAKATASEPESALAS